MSMTASQITSLTIVYSTVYSGTEQRKHQSSMSLAFVWGIHRRPVNSPHKWPVTQKMFPFDDVIMFINTAVNCAKHLFHREQTETSKEHKRCKWLAPRQLLCSCKLRDVSWDHCNTVSVQNLKSPEISFTHNVFQLSNNIEFVYNWHVWCKSQLPLKLQ